MLTATQGDTIYFCRRVGQPPVLKQLNFYNLDNNRVFSMANVPVDWTVSTLLERVATANCCDVRDFDGLEFLFGNIELEPGKLPIPSSHGVYTSVSHNGIDRTLNYYGFVNVSAPRPRCHVPL